MDLADVMQEIGDRLGTIAGLRVYPFPPDTVQTPAAIVTFPDTYTYDETYGRGMDRMTLPVVLMVGKAWDRASRDALAPYLDGAGATSIKAVLETGDRPALAFTASNRTGFAVTLTGLPTGHGFKTGATAVVDSTDNTIDGTFDLIAVTATTVTYPQIGGNDPDTGSGTVAHVPGGAPGYTAFDSLRVMSAEVDVVQMARVDYLAATFALDIAGQGAA